LEVENHYTFTRVLGTERIYSENINFYMEGIWIAVFYENKGEKAVQVYNTKKIPVEGSNVESRSKGPNVIG